MKNFFKFLFLALGIFVFLGSCGPGGSPAEIEEEPEDGNEIQHEPGEMRDITSIALVKDMGLGVNIGNTFESLNENGVAGPTGWGNPNVTQSFIKALKTHGFKTVRLPVSWADYIGAAPDYIVNAAWMTRVQRVVDWILEEDMYCIVNVHHDGAEGMGAKNWIPEGIVKSWETKDPGYEAETFAKYAALWKQIAEKFSYASDKLIFEGLNEPQFDEIWNRYAGGQSAEKTKAFKSLTDLNQTFVDTVRSTGGNNPERFLLVSSYWTDFSNTIDNWGNFFFMPDDAAENKLILSFHYYTPWNFCGGSSLTWGTTANINELNNLFDKVKTGVLDKGIPVILGEYAVELYSGNNPKDSESRSAWMLGVTQKCVDLGICPVLWDTGMRPNNRGMADVQREKPFNISSDLKKMIDGVVWP